MFISRQKAFHSFNSQTDLGEIRQSCAFSSADTSLGTNGPDCKTLGTFEVVEDKDIIVSKDVTGLPEDIKVHLFDAELLEGFVKYKKADLNFLNFNLYKLGFDEKTGSGTSIFDVKFVRCEFDCP